MLDSFPLPSTYAPALRELFEAAGWYPGRVADLPAARLAQLDYPPELQALMQEVAGLVVPGAGRQLVFDPPDVTAADDYDEYHLYDKRGVPHQPARFNRKTYPVGTTAAGELLCVDRYGSFYQAGPDFRLYGTSWAEGLGTYLLAGPAAGLVYDSGTWGPERLVITWPCFPRELLLPPAPAVLPELSPLNFPGALRNLLVLHGWYPGRGAMAGQPPPPGVTAFCRELDELVVSTPYCDLHFETSAYNPDRVEGNVYVGPYLVQHLLGFDQDYTSYYLGGNGPLIQAPLAMFGPHPVADTPVAGLSKLLLNTTAPDELPHDETESRWYEAWFSMSLTEHDPPWGSVRYGRRTPPGEPGPAA